MKVTNRGFSKHYISLAALALLVFAALGCGRGSSYNNSNSGNYGSRNSSYSSSNYNNNSSGYSNSGNYSSGSSGSNSDYRSSVVNSDNSGSKRDYSDSSYSDSGSSEWQAKLGGKKLTWAKNSGTFGEQIDIWFCSSGDYSASRSTIDTSTGGVGAATMSGENNERGKWSVNSSTITFKPRGGSKYEYQISQGGDSQVIRIGSLSYRVDRNSECN